MVIALTIATREERHTHEEQAELAERSGHWRLRKKNLR